jgi:hypothetical protein
MLHIKTVDPVTLSLITSLQSKNYLGQFLLVGGTALALQIGHRTSVDIDLFSNVRFDVANLLNFLQEDYTGLVVRNQMNHALLAEIEKVKTDFVFQPSTLIDNPITIDNIKMATTKEIAAMKISAIIARGKKRDFTDLYCLLDHFSLEEMLNAFSQKYENTDRAIAMRSLFYFEDADDDLDPKCFFEFNWEKIKKRIRQEASKI